MFRNRHKNDPRLSAMLRDGPARYTPDSGFVENWGESLRLDLDEASSLSKILNNTQYEERTKNLMRLYESGAIPAQVMSSFWITKGTDDPYFDYNGLTRWTKRNLDVDFLTDEEIMENIRDDLRYKRELSSDVFNRANFWGKLGQFAGSAHAAVLDPTLLPTYFIGIGGASRGISWLSNFGKASGRAALTEATFETVRQPTVYGWKKTIGADYNFTDAFSNVAAAGLGAGVLTGSAVGLADGLKRFVRKNRIYGSEMSNEAVKVVENTIREMERVPDEKIGASEHAANIEAEATRHEARISKASQPEPATPDVEEGGVPTQPSDNEIEVTLDTLEGETTATYGRVVEEANTLEDQIEKVRSCV